jgi:hypothetical protein
MSDFDRGFGEWLGSTSVGHVDASDRHGETTHRFAPRSATRKQPFSWFATNLPDEIDHVSRRRLGLFQRQKMRRSGHVDQRRTHA